MGEELTGNIQPSLDKSEHQPDLVAKRMTDIPNTLQFRGEVDATATPQYKYIGFGAKGLAITDGGWLVYKCSYDGNNILVLKQSAFGVWNDRDSLAYK